jgi:hypothetical protein
MTFAVSFYLLWILAGIPAVAVWTAKNSRSLLADIWCGFLNGVCAGAGGIAWITGRIARLVVEARRGTPAPSLEERIRDLERLSDQWTEIRMAGCEPLWAGHLGWIPRASVCGCGYIKECRAWCGSGHRTGDCPGHEGEFIDLRGIAPEYLLSDGVTVHPINGAAKVIRSLGMTTDQWAETVKRALRDAGGAL